DSVRARDDRAALFGRALAETEEPLRLLLFLGFGRLTHKSAACAVLHPPDSGLLERARRLGVPVRHPCGRVLWLEQTPYQFLASSRARVKATMPEALLAVKGLARSGSGAIQSAPMAKNPHAVALGRKGGKKGGPKGGSARMAALTPDERSALARKAARARWAK